MAADGKWAQVPGWQPPRSAKHADVGSGCLSTTCRDRATSGLVAASTVRHRPRVAQEKGTTAIKRSREQNSRYLRVLVSRAWHTSGSRFPNRIKSQAGAPAANVGGLQARRVGACSCRAPTEWAGCGRLWQAVAGKSQVIDVMTPTLTLRVGSRAPSRLVRARPTCSS